MKKRENTSQASVTLVDNRCFQLQGKLDFTTVPLLVRTMMKDIRGATLEKQFELDLSQVIYGDSASIAMLLEVNRMGLLVKRKMQIRDMPQQMEIIARVHGVDELLDEMLMH